MGFNKFNWTLSKVLYTLTSKALAATSIIAFISMKASTVLVVHFIAFHLPLFFLFSSMFIVSSLVYRHLMWIYFLKRKKWLSHFVSEVTDNMCQTSFFFAWKYCFFLLKGKFLRKGRGLVQFWSLCDEANDWSWLSFIPSLAALVFRK